MNPNPWQRFHGLTFAAALLVAALAAPAWADDFAARLAAYRLEASDVPATWTVSDFSTADRAHAHVTKNLDRMKERHGDFAYKGQKVEADGAACPLYVFAYRTEAARSWILGTLKLNQKNWKWAFFPLADVVVLAITQDDGLVKKLKDVFARKYAAGSLTRVKALLEAGKASEAERCLSDLVKKAPASAAVFVQVGDLYLRAFSPAKHSAAAVFYRKALSLAGSGGLNAYHRWACHQGLGEVCERADDLAEARAHLDEAAKEAAQVGLRVLARTLAAKARVMARLEDLDSSADCLARALRIEASFGSSEIADLVQGDAALQAVTGLDKVKPLLDKASSATAPEAFADPSADRISFSKMGVLVVPPVVLEGESRRKDLEPHLEKSFARKFGRRSTAFGKDRVLLARWDMDKASKEIVEHVRTSVLGQGNFDLALYEGNRHDIPGSLERLARKALKYGVASKVPDYALASLALVETRGKEVSCTVLAALMHIPSKRITAFQIHTFTCPSRSLVSKIKRVGRDAVRKMETAVRKAGRK